MSAAGEAVQTTLQSRLAALAPTQLEIQDDSAASPRNASIFRNTFIRTSWVTSSASSQFFTYRKASC